MSITTTRPKALHLTEGMTGSQVNGYVNVADRRSPWDVIGKEMEDDNVLTAAEALRQSGLDRIVIEKYPVLDATNGKPIPLMAVTGYDDPDTGDRSYFSPVSDKYKVVQPTESLSYFDGIIEKRGGAHYTAAWAMGEKSRMGVTIELPEALVVDPGGAADTSGLYLLGVNSFDGSTGLGAYITAERFFCTNQLPAIIAGTPRACTFRHTKNVLSKAGVAATTLGMASEYLDELDKWANKLYAQAMTDQQFANIVKRMTWLTLDGTESDLQKGRIMERRDAILDTWRAPHNANITGTAWGAYNALAESIQWGRKVNGSPRTGTSVERQRAIGTLVGGTVQVQYRELSNRFFN